MLSREFMREDYGPGTKSYQKNPIRRGDRVCDTETGKEYKVYGVEGSEIVINSNGDTLPVSRLKKIKKSD